MAAVLASLAPTTSSRVHAQVAVCLQQDGGGYYNPYGQGPYGGYGRGYAISTPANYSVFPSHAGMFGSRAYGYTGYGNFPPGYGNRFDYGTGPNVRVYGRSSYYQPSYGPVYLPFGYRDY